MTSSTEGLLQDQVAIVTGGGGGIGRAIALGFAAAGAHIVIADIRPDRCEEVAERVRGLGREALGVPTDVLDTDQIRSMIEQADKRFGRVDILVNNAGGVTGRPFLEQSERSWRKHIDFNFVSFLAATSAAAPIMIRGGRGGAILNVSSIEGERAAPMYAVYAACKAAMNNFTRTMALELSEHGIRVNVIGPDNTDTPGRRGMRDGPVHDLPPEPQSDQNDATMRRIPLGRIGLDTECADAALFLCSKMGSYVTGVTLPVDGGAWASSGWARNRYTGRWSLTDARPPEPKPE